METPRKKRRGERSEVKGEEGGEEGKEETPRRGRGRKRRRVDESSSLAEANGPSVVDPALSDSPFSRSSSLTPLPSSPPPAVSTSTANIAMGCDKIAELDLLPYCVASEWTASLDKILLAAIDLFRYTPLAHHSPRDVLLSDPAESNYAAAAWEEITQLVDFQLASSGGDLLIDIGPDALHARYEELHSTTAQAQETVDPLRPPLPPSPQGVQVANPSRTKARPWTADEETELWRLNTQGVSPAMIGGRLDRTENAIKRRLSAFATTPRKGPKTPYAGVVPIAPRPPINVPALSHPSPSAPVGFTSSFNPFHDANLFSPRQKRAPSSRAHPLLSGKAVDLPSTSQPSDRLPAIAAPNSPSNVSLSSSSTPLASLVQPAVGRHSPVSSLEKHAPPSLRGG
ncbi:hypothetical protein JCM6882_007376 [Rhodosporidiobolus microsporus]